MPKFNLAEQNNKKIYRFGKDVTEALDFDDTNASAAADKIEFIPATAENMLKYDCTKLLYTLQNHDFTALIMLKNNKVVGYGYLDDGYQHNVTIYPEYKNSGYGTLLMDRLIQLIQPKIDNDELDQNLKLDILQERPFNMNEVEFWKNPEDGTINAVVEYKEKRARLRASILIIKDDMVLLGKDKYDNNKFSLPGGGFEKKETAIEAATREAQEEVHVNVKNVVESGFDYCECHDDVQPWVKTHIPEKKQWYNYYTCLVIGEYAGKFNGEVDEVDEDPTMNETAKFYKIADVIDLPEFKQPWKMAINKYLENRRLNETHLPKKQGKLTEETRSVQVSKSRNAGPYKDKTHGKNRFERKKYSKIATVVKQYNNIDMNEFFKRDTLIVDIPVTGESDNYTVTVKFEGVVAEIAKNIKSNKNQLEYRTVIQALTKVFNTGDVYTKCSCDDFKYRFKHWHIVDNVSVDDTASDPGPGKGIANPNNDKGRGCKHILLVLANLDWIMKVASCIKNYIFYMEEHNTKIFNKIIFPKLYGMTPEEAIEEDVLPDDIKLDSEKHIIELVNDWAKNRGKFKKGTNVNPVTGTGGKAKKEATEDKENTK